MSLATQHALKRMWRLALYTSVISGVIATLQYGVEVSSHTTTIETVKSSAHTQLHSRSDDQKI